MGAGQNDMFDIPIISLGGDCPPPPPRIDASEARVLFWAFRSGRFSEKAQEIVVFVNNKKKKEEYE